LSQLTPETARKIGFMNAEKLFEPTQTGVGRTKVTD
jgi:hypothetical protein